MYSYTVSADDYCAAARPNTRNRASKLEEHRAGLFTLHSRGYNYHQMRDWLALSGVKASPAAIGAFIRRVLATPGVEESEE